MKNIFTCTVTGLGEHVAEMIAEGTIILFGEEALRCYDSPELTSICVRHDFPKPPHFRVACGDVLHVGESEMEVLAVGQAVAHNLKNYGHVTIQMLREGVDLPLKPGDIQVRCRDTPEIREGTVVQILR